MNCPAIVNQYEPMNCSVQVTSTSPVFELEVDFGDSIKKSHATGKFARFRHFGTCPLKFSKDKSNQSRIGEEIPNTKLEIPNPNPYAMGHFILTNLEPANDIFIDGIEINAYTSGAVYFNVRDLLGERNIA